VTEVLGIAAVFSGIVIFCGSVWLLLAIILGGKLAYFVTASVTLGFLLIMGGVWSYGCPNNFRLPGCGDTPLGPVDKVPEWDPIAIGEGEVNFGPAAQYPGDPWFTADPEDDQQKKQAGELEGAAADYLEAEIAAGNTSYAQPEDAIVADDSTKLLKNDEGLFGALILEPGENLATGEPFEGEELTVIMQYDFGHQWRKARRIMGGTFLLFALHLFGLSRAEKAAKRKKEVTA
jgi:hypothetical protein